jgi:hypothetical protein
MRDLQIIELNRGTWICSFDTENMCTNIPKTDTINIINNILQDNQEENRCTQKEILYFLQTVMEQNYFEFDR